MTIPKKVREEACLHKHVCHYFTEQRTDGKVNFWVCRPDESVQAIVCLDCGTWLPLGPSDEAPVAVEIDAAFVAATWDERKDEWLTMEALSDQSGRNAEVIGLARAIIEHEDGQS